MEEPPKKKLRWLLWLVLPLLLIVGGAAALVFVLGNSGLSARYDDIDAILADYDRSGYASFTRNGDGTAAVHLEKEDMYYLLKNRGLCPELEEALASDGELRQFGVRLQDGAVRVYLSRKGPAGIPISYKVGVRTLRDGRTLILQPESVVLGTRIRLPENRWPEPLRREYRLDMSVMDGGEEITGLALNGSEVTVELQGLRGMDPRGLRINEDLLTAMDFLGVPREAREMYNRLRSSDDGAFPAEELLAQLPLAGDAAETLSDWLAWAVPDSRSTLWQEKSTFCKSRIWAPILERTVKKQQALTQFLTGEQAKYERLLFAVREMYRGGTLKMEDNGFRNALGEKVDPSTLSKLDVSATDSRIVFLFDTSDSGEISVEDMPTLETVPRVDWRTAKLADTGLRPDVGVVLTTEGGVPVLLHRRADGALAFRELTEADYVAVLVCHSIPRLQMTDLPAPAGEFVRSAGEGWNGAVLLPLPKEE